MLCLCTGILTWKWRQIFQVVGARDSVHAANPIIGSGAEIEVRHAFDRTRHRRAEDHRGIATPWQPIGAGDSEGRGDWIVADPAEHPQKPSRVWLLGPETFNIGYLLPAIRSISATNLEFRPRANMQWWPKST